MHTTTLSKLFVVIASISLVVAGPLRPRFTVGPEHFEVLKMRSSREVNPKALLQIECIDRKAHIVFHDQNVAELSICGGIAGDKTSCEGSPKTTIGHSSSAKFELRAVHEEAHINISKDRWEQCVRAARAVCPTGSLKAVCAGGASSGDVEFTLGNP